jgi:hypothetical protein
VSPPSLFLPSFKRGRSSVVERLSQQEVGGSIPTRPLRVHEIKHAEAKPFIEANHYSRLVPSGKNIYFGGYLDEELYCVASYGSPKAQMVSKMAEKNPYIEFLRKKIDPSVTPENLFELTRLCRIGAKNTYGPIFPNQKTPPLTRFLAICHRLMKRYHGARFIISFCDSQLWGFDGAIYKAANFKSFGQTLITVHTIDEKLKDKDPREVREHIVHRRVAYKAMKNWNAKHPDQKVTIADMRQRAGRVPFKTPPKDRWFLDLGD